MSPLLFFISESFVRVRGRSESLTSVLFCFNVYFLFCALTDGPPVTNRVDGAAEVLGVHVRRIYELIKILEILSLVTVSFVTLFAL